MVYLLSNILACAVMTAMNCHDGEPTHQCDSVAFQRYAAILDYVRQDTFAQEFMMHARRDTTLILADTVLCLSRVLVRRDVMLQKYNIREQELFSGRYDFLRKAEYLHALQWEKTCKGYLCDSLRTLNSREEAAFTLYCSVPDGSMVVVQLSASYDESGGTLQPGMAGLALLYLFRFDERHTILSVSSGISQQ